MTVYTGAFVLRNAVITINSIDYTNQCRKARLVPDTNVQTYKTLIPDGTIVDADIAVWTFEVEGVQGNAAGGLAKALRDAQGTVLTAIIQPQAGSSKPTASFSFLVLAVPFGGEQGVFMDFDASFPVQGVPTFGTSA